MIGTRRDHAFYSRTSALVALPPATGQLDHIHASATSHRSDHSTLSVVESPYHSIVGSLVHRIAPHTGDDSKDNRPPKLTSPSAHTYFVDSLSQSHPQQPQSTRYMSPQQSAASAQRPAFLDAKKPKTTLEYEVERRLLHPPPKSPPPSSQRSRPDHQEVHRPATSSPPLALPVQSAIVRRLMAPSFLSPSSKVERPAAEPQPSFVSPHRYESEKVLTTSAELQKRPLRPDVLHFPPDASTRDSLTTTPKKRLVGTSDDGCALASPISHRLDDSKTSDFVDCSDEFVFASPKRPPPPPPVIAGRTAPSQKQADLPPRRRPPLLTAEPPVSTTHAKTSVPAESSSSEGGCDDDVDDLIFATRVAEAYAYDCYSRDASHYMHPLLAAAFCAREKHDRNVLYDSQVIELGNVCTATQLGLACTKVLMYEEEDRHAIVSTSHHIFNVIHNAYLTTIPRCARSSFVDYPTKGAAIVRANSKSSTVHSVDPISEALLGAKNVARSTVGEVVQTGNQWTHDDVWVLADRPRSERLRRAVTLAPQFVCDEEAGAKKTQPLNVAEYLLRSDVASRRQNAAGVNGEVTADLHFAPQPGPVRQKASIGLLAAAIEAPSRMHASSSSPPRQRSKSAASTDPESSAAVPINVVFQEELAAFHKVHVAPSRAVVTDRAGIETNARDAASPEVVHAVAHQPQPGLVSCSPQERLANLRAAILSEVLSSSSSSSTVSSRAPTPRDGPPLPPGPSDDAHHTDIFMRLSQSSSSSLGSLSVNDVSE